MNNSIGKTGVVVKQFEPTFHVDQSGRVVAADPDGTLTFSHTVEAHLLYAILQLLEKSSRP